MSKPPHPPTARWRDLFVRRHVASLLVIGLAVTLHAADGLLVATMLPVIVADIGGTHLMSWVVMLYEVGSIIVGASSGYLLIRFGLRYPMALCALSFALGCGISAAASTMPTMLWGRLFQGLGGGGLMAMSFVAVTTLFERYLRARAIALISTLWAGSAFLGPLIGGVFVEFATWRLAFWTFATAALALTIFIWIMASPIAETSHARGTWPVGRLTLLATGILCIAFAGEEISLVRTPLLIALGSLLLVGFLYLDGRTPKGRLLPRCDPLLRDRASATIGMVVAFAAGTITIGAYAPFFLVTLHGLSPLQAGYLIAIEAVAWAGVAALVSGRPESQDCMMIAIGLITVVAGVIGLWLFIASGPVLLVAFAALLQGAGFGMAWSFIPRFATAGQTDTESALISAAIPTAQRIGYALGAALLGMVANASGISHTPDPQTASTVFAIGLPLVLLGLLCLAKLSRSESHRI
ncbi:MFS transporter [Aliiroseovarius sp. 2305UL8-7]|uniref:MFS transporter n=1 Tax=Aliiroseovarius conchicola TaxID=3121637 RepID=UPI003529B7D6